MQQSCMSGSVEGVMGDHDSYSDRASPRTDDAYENSQYLAVRPEPCRRATANFFSQLRGIKGDFGMSGAAAIGCIS
jgi:hypothetical protein